MLAAAVIFGGASAQSTTGIGFSLICAPILTVILGGGDGVRLVNVLSTVVNLLLLRTEWRGADLKRAAALFLPAALAAPAVAIGMRFVNAHILSISVGLIVLAAVSMLAAGYRIRALTGRSGAVVAGALSGSMNVVGGVSGPIAASYATIADWPLEIMRPTLNVYFLGVNLISVASRGVPPMSTNFWLLVLAAVFLGFVGGAHFAKKLDKFLVRKITLSLAALGGFGAILSGLLR